MHKIFFYHMPKAGGTSINSALKNTFDVSCIAPLIENDSVGHQIHSGQYRSFRGFDFYSGHYGTDIFDAVADGHISLSNFRHPVTRIYSLYRYFRGIEVSAHDLSQRQYAAVRRAKDACFADFVATDDEAVSIYISDQQARQLTGSPWALQKEIDTNAAKARIDQLAWFYVCEQPEASLAWLGEVLGIYSIPVLNVTPQTSVSEELKACEDTILERNQIDLALYKYAMDRLNSGV
ncbi:hypothetical protein C1T17_01040 [Sphingobium sp. SCG-1]|uniref:hypothetical protein n=1 Tax=Sphingobium sp. SCG-1 TaxID=2072936 RepID=UPI000CD679EF|nr:hypothetical protein [Sphingobium sp. SCG-1]AUW56867.1 hypothetical protein C1T17_01040 [Sphingobium sp. SCG-1]